MFSEAQHIMIRTVCSWQFQSLENILLQPDLEEDYLLILEQHGCGRHDFDTVVIAIRRKFQEIHDEPEKLFEMGELDIDTFVFILNHIQGDWETLYPKALNNLKNRIFVHKAAHNIDHN